ncbi:MAG: peptidylprolyl isomerase [Actinomycetota bacterium]|nr:peptidylprolyl isomerase [Actinomycetota bacterium]
MGTEKRDRQRSNRALKQEQMVKLERRTKTRRGLLRGILLVVGLVLVVVAIAYFSGIGGGDDDDEPTVDSSTDLSTDPSSTASSTVASGFEYATGDCAPADKPAEPVRQFEAAPQQCIDPEAAYTATFATSEGDIVVELATSDVPGTVNNFVNLARFGYYDDTAIFRADPSIDIIQGGGEDNTTSPGYTIPDEGGGFTYEPGDLVMARTQQPDSSGGQWFFAAGPDVSNLDQQGTYVKFGTITEGLDVAEGILGLSGDDGQTPTKDVAVETVTITES